MSSEGRVVSRTEGPVAWMIFDNQSRRNAISTAMWRAIPEVLQAFEADEAIRVVVVSGAGDTAFVAGADISQFQEERASAAAVKAYDETAERAFDAFAAVTKPIIAQIHGYCIGGGLGLALACDLRIAADDARFGIPAARLGLGYAFSGVKKLTDVVGPAFAKEVFFTARQFDADEALKMGLVNRVFGKDQLDTSVTAMARDIAQNAPLSVRAAKLGVDAASSSSHGVDTSAVAAAVSRCFGSADYIEGRTAFMEKRKPVFRGR